MVTINESNRIDYCAAFHEVYDDLKGYRESCQFEVTMKTLDMDEINALVPRLEASLPFEKEFCRYDHHSDYDKKTIMNASINLRFCLGAVDSGVSQRHCCLLFTK